MGNTKVPKISIILFYWFSGSATRQKSDPGSRPDFSKPTAHIPPSARVNGAADVTETVGSTGRASQDHVRGRPDGASAQNQRPTGWGIPRQPPARPSPQAAEKSSPIYQPTHVKLPERGEADGGAATADSSSARPRSTSTVGGGVRRKPRHHARTQQPNVNVQCPLCARSFPKDRVEFHAATCEGRVSPDEVEIVEETPSPQRASQQNKRMRNVDIVTCPICNEAYSKTVIEEHAANCGDEVYV